MHGKPWVIHSTCHRNQHSAFYCKNATLREDVPLGNECYLPSIMTSISTRQRPVSRSPVTQIQVTKQKSTMSTHFLRNFYVEPPTLIVPFLTLSGQRKADQRNLIPLPDGSVVIRLRAGRPMDQSNPPSSSYIRYKAQPLIHSILPVNQLQQY